jgi:hypothetical protein
MAVSRRGRALALEQRTDYAPGSSIHDVLASSPLRPARHFAHGSRLSALD